MLSTLECGGHWEAIALCIRSISRSKLRYSRGEAEAEADDDEDDDDDDDKVDEEMVEGCPSKAHRMY